jgi:hypothetical protein
MLSLPASLPPRPLMNHVKHWCRYVDSPLIISRHIPAICAPRAKSDEQAHRARRGSRCGRRCAADDCTRQPGIYTRVYMCVCEGGAVRQYSTGVGLFRWWWMLIRWGLGRNSTHLQSETSRSVRVTFGPNTDTHSSTHSNSYPLFLTCTYSHSHSVTLSHSLTHHTHRYLPSSTKSTEMCTVSTATRVKSSASRSARFDTSPQLYTHRITSPISSPPRQSRVKLCQNFFVCVAF